MKNESTMYTMSMRSILIAFFMTFLVVANSGCTKPQNTEALKIGINEKISSQILYLAHVLGYYASEEIQFSRVKTDAELLKELSIGKIDIATLRLDHAQGMMKKSNDFKILLYMRILKEKAGISESKYNPNMNVLVIRKSIADKNPQKIATLLDGWYSTLHYIDDHPEQIADSFSQELKIDSNQLKEASLLYLLSDK